MKSMKPMLVASLVIAAASIGGPMVFRYEPNLSRATNMSFCLGAVWLLTLCAALIRFKKRGLWFLVGAPFALLVPLMWIAIYWQCQVMGNFNACP